MNTPAVGNIAFSRWMRRNVVITAIDGGCPTVYTSEDESGQVNKHYLADLEPVDPDTTFNTWHTSQIESKVIQPGYPICPWIDGPNTTYGLFAEEPLVSKDEALHAPGAKDDADKPPVGMIMEYFPRALMAVAGVAGYGAEKYTRGGWASVPDGMNRYSDALGRHLLVRHIDEDMDKESGFPHLAHAAWNALAILELSLRDDDK